MLMGAYPALHNHVAVFPSVQPARVRRSRQPSIIADDAQAPIRPAVVLVCLCPILIAPIPFEASLPSVHIGSSTQHQVQAQRTRSNHILILGTQSTYLSNTRAKRHTNMCLITTPRKEPRYDVHRGRDYDAPRPVSNYHGGPAYRTSATYARPPSGYRRSVSRTRIIEAEPRRSGREMDYVRIEQPRRSGRSVDYVRTSRTYVR